MALVRNTSDHEQDLDVGSIQAFEVKNIDTSGPTATRLLGDGTLLMVDNTAAPAAPEPFINTPRRIFRGSAQPSALRLGDIWFETDSAGNLKSIWEMSA